MTMQQTKPIMEELARARNHFHRHEILRSMISLATAVKSAATSQLVGRDKSLVENGLQEIVQLLNRTQEVQKYSKNPDGLVLEKGKFKSLFQNLMHIIKSLHEEASRETEEQTRQRKLNLDSNLSRGQKFLDAGNLGEADNAFQEAIKCYVDEHKLFYMIGAKLLQTKHPRPALKYLLKGLEVDPEPMPLVVTAAQAYMQLKQPDKAEKLLMQYIKGCRDPEAYALLAQAQAVQKKPDAAIRNAARGLKLDPGHKLSRKIFAQLKKARGQAKKAKAAS